MSALRNGVGTVAARLFSLRRNASWFQAAVPRRLSVLRGNRNAAVVLELALGQRAQHALRVHAGSLFRPGKQFGQKAKAPTKFALRIARWNSSAVNSLTESGPVTLALDALLIFFQSSASADSLYISAKPRGLGVRV